MVKKNEKNSEVSFRNSIRVRLPFIMTLLIVVSIAAAVSISYYNSTTKDMNDALKILDSNVKFMESKFETIIQKNVLALETFASSRSTIDYIKKYGSDEEAVEGETILSQMDIINTHMNDGNDSCILSLKSGDQILRTDRNENKSIADRDYFQECMTTKNVAVSNVVETKATGTRKTIIIVPIVDDETGEIIGTIQRSFDLSVLHEFLSENISDGFIADKNGLVAAHATHEITPDDEPEDLSKSVFMSSSDTSGVYLATSHGMPQYVSWSKEPITGYTIAVVAKKSEIMAEARSSAAIVIIVGIILIIISMLIAIWVSKSFTEPIGAVGNSLGALADGRFIQVEKFSARNDEFGAISRATNSVIGKLEGIVSNIKSSALEVTSSSENLSEMADQISKTAEDVSNAIQDVAMGATDQANEIKQATESVGDISNAVGNVKNSTESLTEITGKMKEASELSGNSLASLQDISEEMTEKINVIAETIHATQEAVDSINEKVEGITTIAMQTNLLSLNASIEAARAGEAGRGFAVVAEEIGKLAEDSGKMAGDIRKEMAILLEQSNAAVVAAGDVQHGNSTQQHSLKDTLEAVNGMIVDIKNTVDGVKSISSGAEICESSKGKVVEAMDALSSISEENAASSEETGASMEELSATVTTLAESAGDLKTIAEKLSNEMKFFKA